MVLQYSDQLPLGWVAPEFSLTSAMGRLVRLSDFADRPGLLVVFTCNHCPYAQAAWPILVDLHEEFHDQVQFVAINSNDPVQVPEDGIDKMRELIVKMEIEFPYVIDEDKTVANALHAQCTPDLYLFKNNGQQFELFYHGRVNDNWQHPENVTEHSLLDALRKLTADETPPANQYPSMGCSLK